MGGSYILSHLRLCDTLVELHRCFLPHLISDMGVSVQGGRTEYMAKDGGQGFNVHPVGQSIGCMAQIMKPDIRQPRPFQQGFQPIISSAWVGRLFWFPRMGEDPFRLERPFSLPEQFYSTGRQSNRSDPRQCLGIPSSQFAATLLMYRAANFERSIVRIKVSPLEAADLTVPQAGGQFCIEEVIPDSILPDNLHKSFQLLIR